MAAATSTITLGSAIGPIAHDGRFYRLHVTPTVPVAPPPRIDLPIYLAGVNPRMIQAAGTVGDGLVGHPLFTPEYVRDVARPALARGAERAGRGHAIALCGTPEEVRARYAQRWAGVYEHTLLWPPAFRGMDGVRAVIEAFADPVSTAARG